MLVTLVSECQDKSICVTRRILAKYLPQIGSRTWMGQISQEGLDNLYQELKAKVTKNSSIACFRCHGYSKTIYLWHLGSKSLYHDGVYSFSQSSKLDSLKELKKLSKHHHLLRDLVKLSGLLHDIGKNNIGFQRKLQYKGKPDLIRHELFSYLILHEFKEGVFIKENKRRPEYNDKTLFDYLANRNHIIDFFSNFKISKTLKEVKNIKLSAYDCKNMPLWSSLCWLVASHHKLTDFVANDTNITLDEINFQKLINDDPQLNLADYTTFKDHRIFVEDSFLNQLTSLATALNSYTIEENIFYADMIYFIPYWCRPILIYSDYLGSKNKDKDVNSLWDNVLANTAKGNPADTLLCHLTKVKKYAHSTYNKLFNWQTLLDGLNVLNRTDLDFLDIEYKQIERANNFSWQQQAINLLLDSEQSPTFGIILSGTGSGKTRAIPKIMASLSSESIRYTLCLGFRSLTLQTMDEYKNIGFKEHSFATVVGGVYANSTFNAISNNVDQNVSIENDNIENNDQESGTSNNLNIEDANVYFNIMGDYKIPVLDDDLKALYPEHKYRSMLSAPIVIATIDHFINCGSLLRGADTKLQLRLMTSDLVLDEIDSYTDEQLVAVSRLVFLAGLYGRSVILASATISPIIVESFLHVYQEGLNKYNFLNDVKEDFKKLRLGLFSNYHEHCIVKTFDLGNDSKPLICETYKYFTEKIVDSLKKQPPYRRARVLDINDAAKPSTFTKNDDNFSLILNGIYNLHNNNHEVYENPHRTVSIGFVKFNRTDTVIDFAKFLLECKVDDDYEIIVICYHAKLMKYHRILNERLLNKLKRKNRKLLSIPEIKNRVDLASKPNCIIIVSTSPIIETGVDHDYDWCALEPSSTRAIIQASGRILRHRTKNDFELDVAQYNVLLMSNPYRCDPSKEVYARPGVENSIKFINDENPLPLIDKKIHKKLIKFAKEIFTTVDYPPRAERLYKVQDVFNMAYQHEFVNKIDQSIAIQLPLSFDYSYITSYELLCQHIRLNRLIDNSTKEEYEKNYIGQTNYIYDYPLLMFKSKHFLQNVLRDDDYSKEYFYDLRDKKWFVIDNGDSKYAPSSKIISNAHVKSERLFFNKLVDDEVIKNIWDEYFKKPNNEYNRNHKYKTLALLILNDHCSYTYYSILGARTNPGTVP